jgi:hypothetical protein
MINGTRTLNILTLFGPIEVTFSKCPLLDLPVSVKTANPVPANEIQHILNDLSTRAKILKLNRK